MADGAPRQTLRADKWLWYARFFKTRSLAAKAVSGGHMRINGVRTTKPAHAVGVSDVLTFPQGHHVRVIEIAACGVRRGPAPEARTLYVDRTPRTEAVSAAPRYDGGGRPTKKDRRDMAARGPAGWAGPLE